MRFRSSCQQTFPEVAYPSIWLNNVSFMHEIFSLVGRGTCENKEGFHRSLPIIQETSAIKPMLECMNDVIAGPLII